MTRFLKVLAILVLVLTLAGAGAAVYAYRHRMPEAVSSSADILSASEREEEKAAWFRQAEDGLFAGTAAENWKDFEDGDLVFWQCTLRVRNDGFFPAEWIALEPQPQAGDVMILPDAQPKVLGARSEGDLAVTVLCTGEAAAKPRELLLSCTVLGHRETVSYTVTEGKLTRKEGTER